MNKISQSKRIVEYINTYGSITCLEAEHRLGIQRLAARIADLKKQGYVIDSEMVEVRNRYNEVCRVKRYYLCEEA